MSEVMNEAGHATPRGSPLFLIGWIAVVFVGIAAFVAFAPCVTCEVCKAIHPGDWHRLSWICMTCKGRDKLTLLEYWKCECRE